MTRAILVVVLCWMTWSWTASADPISLAIERDNLLPLVDPTPSVVARPRIDAVMTEQSSGHDRAWRALDITTLALSNAMLVADAAYTHRAAARGWASAREVGMPAAQIMGTTPSTAAVTTYFASAIAINTALWLVLPPRWRSILPGVIIGAQADALAYNYGLCHDC